MFEYLEEDKAISEEMKLHMTEQELPTPSVVIDAPLAYVGDEVVFDNPRKKTHDDLDSGVVVKVLTRWGAEHNVYSHAYYVKPHGKNYVTKVGYVERVVFP